MGKAIALDAISENKSSQVRSRSRDEGANGCDLDTVLRYMEITSLPPIDVFRLPDSSLIIGDGWHRLEAAKQRGDTTIQANEHTGSLNDAKVFAIRANSRHGLPLCQLDRDRAIEFLHDDLGWSSRKIGKEIGCDHKTVLNVVKEHEVEKAFLGKFPQATRCLGTTEARTIHRAPKEYWADLANAVNERRWTGMKIEEIEAIAVKLSDPDVSDEEKAAILAPPEPEREPDDEPETAPEEDGAEFRSNEEIEIAPGVFYGKPKEEESDDEPEEVEVEEEGDSDETVWRRGFMYRAEDAIIDAEHDDWSGFRVDAETIAASAAATEAWSATTKYLQKLFREQKQKQQQQEEAAESVTIDKGVPMPKA